MHLNTYSSDDSAHAQKALSALPEVGRTLPHSLEAEQALLACLLIDPTEAVPLCLAARFVPASFYDQRNGMVYAAIDALAKMQKPVDIATVAERLRETGALEEAGGFAHLGTITQTAPTTAQLRFWIGQVRTHWILRQTIRQAQRAIEQCHGYSGEPFAEFLAPHAAWFQTATMRARQGESAAVETLGIVIAQIRADVAARAAGTEDRSGWIFTGFPEFDHLESSSCMMPLGSMREDGNVIIGGGSSMGKSVLMRNIATLAVERGQRALVYTIETNRYSFIQSMAATSARASVRGLNRAPKDHVARLDAALVALEAKVDKKLFLFQRSDDPGFETIEGIVAHARAWCAQHGTPHVIVLDYLQLIGVGKRCNSREQEVAHISHTWQALQRELGCVTIGGAQLNEASLSKLRQVKKDKETGAVIHELPDRGALRESQALYHDADVVIFLHMPVVDGAGREQVGLDTTNPEMWLCVDKRRSGVRGIVKTRFEKAHGYFKPLHEAGPARPAASGPTSKADY
jgi:replicative DNA helicase